MFGDLLAIVLAMSAGSSNAPLSVVIDEKHVGW